MKKTILRCLISILFISAAIGAEEDIPKVVSADITSNGDLYPVQLPAVVLSKNVSILSMEVFGRLTKVLPIGTSFEKGDVLAEVDETDKAFQLELTKSQIKQQENQVLRLSAQLERYKKTQKVAATSESEYDAVRYEFGKHKERVNELKLQFEMDKLALERASLRAPFTGTVMSVKAAVGEYTQPGLPVLSVVDTVNLHMHIKMPSKYYSNVELGMPIAVFVNDKEVRTRVSHKVGAINPQSDMFEILAEPIPNLLHGQRFDVVLYPNAHEAVYALDSKFIVREPESVFIWIINADDTVEKLPIELLNKFGDQTYFTINGKTISRYVVSSDRYLTNGERVAVSAQ